MFHACKSNNAISFGEFQYPCARRIWGNQYRWASVSLPNTHGMRLHPESIAQIPLRFSDNLLPCLGRLTPVCGGVKCIPSSSNVISSRRRPPQLRGGDVPVCMFCRNRACKRGTVALETPSNAAVCSRVAPMMEGKRTACAQRSSAASLELLTAHCACLTNSSLIFRGLHMP